MPKWGWSTVAKTFDRGRRVCFFGTGVAAAAQIVVHEEYKAQDTLAASQVVLNQHQAHSEQLQSLQNYLQQQAAQSPFQNSVQTQKAMECPYPMPDPLQVTFNASFSGAKDALTAADAAQRVTQNIGCQPTPPSAASSINYAAVALTSLGLLSRFFPHYTTLALSAATIVCYSGSSIASGVALARHHAEYNMPNGKSWNEIGPVKRAELLATTFLGLRNIMGNAVSPLRFMPLIDTVCAGWAGVNTAIQMMPSSAPAAIPSDCPSIMDTVCVPCESASNIFFGTLNAAKNTSVTTPPCINELNAAPGAAVAFFTAKDAAFQAGACPTTLVPPPSPTSFQWMWKTVTGLVTTPTMPFVASAALHSVLPNAGSTASSASEPGSHSDVDAPLLNPAHAPSTGSRV